MTKPIRTSACRALSQSFVALGLAAVLAVAPVTPGQADDDIARDCIDQLGDPDVDIIACTVPFQLKRRARDDLMRVTGGVLRDAGCLVEVGLERATVFDALVHAQNLEVPAQPVECDVETDRRPLNLGVVVHPIGQEDRQQR